MTAKEYFAKRNGGKTAQEMGNDREFVGAKWCEKLMKEYALHIAEKAVSHVTDEQPYKKSGDRESYSRYREGIEAGADAVLSRIKKLTQGESPLTQTNEDK